MSFAVHDSQPTQAWTGMHSKKRKHAVISRHENNEIHDLRSNTLESSRKEPTRVVYKRTTPTQSRGASPDSGVSTVNQFLIDGNAPVQPHPTLVAKKTEVRHGPGRHRSVDIKGLIMELIDETYPPTVCPTCLYTASGRSDADLHFKTEHHGNKAFKCVDPTCEQAYSSKPGLRYHLEHAHKVTLVSDTSESPRRSDRCSTSSPITRESNKKLRKQEVSPHLQQKLDEVYDVTTCPSCREKFKRKTHVIRHLVEVHHGEEPYRCIVSGCKRTKAYATREGLVYHLVSYHDELQQSQ